MSTSEIILLFLFIWLLIEIVRTARSWYEAEVKSYELAILREKHREHNDKSDRRMRRYM